VDNEIGFVSCKSIAPLLRLPCELIYIADDGSLAHYAFKGNFGTNSKWRISSGSADVELTA